MSECEFCGRTLQWKTLRTENASLQSSLRTAEEALEKLKPSHYSCEDNWYQCPKAEGGCGNDNIPDECQCGADERLIIWNQALAKIRGKG